MPRCVELSPRKRPPDTPLAFAALDIVPASLSPVGSVSLSLQNPLEVLTILIHTENLRVWCIDIDKKRLYVHDVAMGKLGRDFTSVKIDENDEMMYVGTMSGDVVKVRLNCHENPDIIDREKSPVLLGCYGRHNARKPPGKDCEKYNNGVRDLLLLAPGYLLIGAGDGQIELVEERNCNFKNYKNPTWPQFKTVRI